MQSQQAEGVGRLGGVDAACGGDGGAPGAGDEAEHEVVEGGQDVGDDALARLAVVLAQGDVAASAQPGGRLVRP